MARFSLEDLKKMIVGQSAPGGERLLPEWGSQ